MPAPAGTCEPAKHPMQKRCSSLVGAAWMAWRQRQQLTCCHGLQVSVGIQVITQKRCLGKG